VVKDGFKQHESRLVHYAWTILGDLKSARDVARDTFLKLCLQEPGNVAILPRYSFIKPAEIGHWTSIFNERTGPRSRNLP